MAHTSSPGGGVGEAEVQLWQTKKEQAQFQDLADLYSIIVAVEKLEKARRCHRSRRTNSTESWGERQSFLVRRGSPSECNAPLM